ncbi:DNA alkylation repair protein [Brachyspira pilosicoli]|uniref:DNA alkylation repair protein n=1 Tax=Brachyspira pilosicoli TaxID=52584 RepID=UPI001C67123F|nr:DNA alkylation repair protein [Brachyspira pilosicoli]MBW5396869.1 DNA alkylation repair protein [Brachyspira pilosicoli]
MLNDIFEQLTKLQNNQKSKEMSAYMKNKFEFLGVDSKSRKNIENNIFREYKKTDNIDFCFTDKCFKSKYREFQYCAIDYLSLKKKYLNKTHIEKLKEYILTKSWWDSVDGFHRIIGDIALRDEDVNSILLEWSVDDNFWLRRVAICHQLIRKNNTNTNLLEEIIINNLNQNEFFINKAIGWALRDYSKTNTKWVVDFINKHKNNMSNLSIKEASKYL